MTTNVIISIMSGRSQNPQNSGRQQNDSAGYPRYDRDASRAWNHQRRNQPPSDRWADDTPYEEPPTNERRKERNKTRMKTYKQKKQQPPPKPDKIEPEKATREDSAQDAPLYDATPFTAGVPFNQEYSQNFDCSGFPVICQETYATLEGINPRLSRDMPFPMFLHNMNCVLQTSLIDAVYEDGRRPVPGHSSRAEDVLPPEYVIPGPIYEFVSILSTVTTPGNQEVKLNLPDIMVPQPGYMDDDDVEVPSGTFGPITAETHNVYETQLCPYTTMRYIEVSSAERPPPDWDPITPELAPEDGIPTRDFLGYLPIPRLHAEGKQTMRAGRFEEGDSITGRIRYNAELFTKGNAELSKMKDKFKMITCGMEKDARKYVKFKSDPGNLVFTETIDPASALNTRMVRLLSNFSYGTNAAGSAGIHVLHRRRTIQAPGCCYTFNAEYAQNWIETRNSLFEMLEPFAPTRGVDLPQLRDALTA